jgi:8-oxo-dGTP pyrophosphatase MutT (NUDIX family)
VTQPHELHNQVVEGEPRDAASVVLLRDGAHDRLEVFLLRRGGSTTVMNDAYVFPGGKVDPEDASPRYVEALDLRSPAPIMLGEPTLDPMRAASLFVAACRETLEETGVQVQANALIPLSRWITPKVPAMMKKRFDTRFFLACIDASVTATHDGQEADASVWLSPREALERYRDRQIELAPPQIMTLIALLPARNFGQVRQQFHQHIPKLIEPMSFLNGEERFIAYPGHPRHAVQERAMPGPTCLVYRDNRFQPEHGYQQLFN